MRSPEAVLFSNISATPAAFLLEGGAYVLDVVATWGGGSVTLNRLGPDGSTYLAAVTALTATGTSGAVALPKGRYQLAIATATAVYASVVRVPGE
jgi:hypothetical protein